MEFLSRTEKFVPRNVPNRDDFVPLHPYTRHCIVKNVTCIVEMKKCLAVKKKEKVNAIKQLWEPIKTPQI